MTVCIAALCEERKTLVLVSDKKISFGTFSGENMALKNTSIYGAWIGMYSGNDVSHAVPVLSKARELMKAYHDKFGTLDAPTVANIVHEAYWRRLKHQIETRVLRRHGFTVETFQQKGKRSFTEAVYTKLSERIANVTLDQLMFLIAGFEDDGVGHLWTVGEDEAPQCFDAIGVWAIGSGHSAALSALSFNIDKGQLAPPYSDLSRTLYCACAAKFMAESASDVGRSTFVVVHRGTQHRPLFIDPPDIDKLRRTWLRSGAPRIPRNTASLEEMLHTARP